MQVSGLVVGVKDGSYESKREPGKKVQQWNIDVYDRTINGVVPCNAAGAADFVPPAVETKIVADVTSIRKINFGVGYVVSIANIRPATDAASQPPPGRPR